MFFPLQASALLLLTYLRFCCSSQWKAGDMELPLGLNSAAIGTLNDDTTYIIGGFNGEYLDSVYKLTADASTWIKLSVSAPSKFLCWSQCSVTVNDELIYIINPMTIHGIHGAIYIFNTTTEQFIDSNTFVPIQYIRSCVTTDENNELIFVLGGMTSDYSGIPYLQTLNVTSNQWNDYTNYRPPPLLRWWSLSCYFDDNTQKLYAFGGYGWYNNKWQYLRNIYIYDVAGNQWTRSDQQLSVPRDNTRAVAVIHDIYIIGGYGDDAEVSNVDIYNINSQTISFVDNMLTNEGVVMATNINNSVHVFGGGPDGVYSSSHEYFDRLSIVTTMDPSTSTAFEGTVQDAVRSTQSTTFESTESIPIESKQSTTVESTQSIDIQSTQSKIESTQSITSESTQSTTSVSVWVDDRSDISVKVLFVLFFLLPFTLFLIAVIFHLFRKGTDHPNYLSLFRFFSGIGDFYTDIVWAITLYIHYYNITNIWIYAFIFTIGSHVISVIIGFIFITKWRKHRKKQYIKDYIDRYDHIIMFLMIFSSFYALMDVISSHLFHIEMLSFQVNDREKRRIQNLRLFNEVLLENLPLLSLQSIFLLKYQLNEDMNINVMNQITVLAIVLSLISMFSGILTLFSRVLSGCRNDSECNYTKIVFVSIESMKQYIKPYHIHSHNQLKRSFIQTLQIYENEVEVMYISRITNGIKAKLKFTLDQNIDDEVLIDLEDRTNNMGNNFLLEIKKRFKIKDIDELIVSVSREKNENQISVMHPQTCSSSSTNVSSVSSITNSSSDANDLHYAKTVSLQVIAE